MLWPHPVLGRSSYELESGATGSHPLPGETGPLASRGQVQHRRQAQLHLDLLKDLGSGSDFPAVQQQQVTAPPGAPLSYVIWE